MRRKEDEKKKDAARDDTRRAGAERGEDRSTGDRRNDGTASTLSDRQKRNAAAREAREKLRRTNRDIMSVTYVFIALFVGMIGYLGYFLYHDGDSYRNNSYNSRRQALLEEKYTRGEIQAADGSTLAVTNVDDDGNETREYPYGRAFAHVVGYASNGVAGLESQAGSYLLNTHENILIRMLEEIRGVKSVGDTVVTTLNVDLQQTAHDALGDYSGAVVVIEPSTGKVLAMASRPGFNPNTLAENYEDLISDSNSDGNLVNRASQGLYTPGSTFKLLTALEFIREYPDTWQDFTFDCDGVYEVDDYSIQCSKKTRHGEVDLEEAFAESCNGAFAEIGQMLDFQKFKQLCDSFGYNTTWEGGTPATQSSFVLDNNDSLWDILQTSIGQGETQVTPLFNAMIAASVANGGVMMVPYLIDSVKTRYGNQVASFSSKEYRTVMTEEEAEILQEFMEACVSDGTGDEAAGSGYVAYGKTGSAETSKKNATNAWFIGYAEDENNPNRKIAVSVIVEQGGSGGSVAAPIAGKIFKEYFSD